VPTAGAVRPGGPHREGEEPKPMMNGLEKSDPAIVAGKPANKGAQAPAEWVEPRAGTEGNTDQARTRRTQSRCSVSPGLERVRQAAKADKGRRFTALLHHVDVALLEWAYFALNKQAAAGVDGLTWKAYGQELQSNLQSLHQRLHRGGYRALPVRRGYIDKGGGAFRPLGITAVEDKIVQRALVEVLNEIYEEDFLETSYGFRPGRSAHDALDALCVGIGGQKVNWILDADIRSYFDTIDQEWLIKMMEQRIGDGRVIRLLRRWLRAGVLEDGKYSVSEQGTPQGAVISPLLANVYLHYVYDLWARQWQKRQAKGQLITVRYADDFVAGFEHEADARRFWDELRQRLEVFGLELHGLKTRLLFLGFVFICGRSRAGGFQLKRKSRSDRMRGKLQEIKAELRRRMHQPVTEQGRWLRQVVQGYNAYHAVPTNLRAIGTFRHHVADLWRRTLKRRSQRTRVTWERMDRLFARWLPTPRILHAWPERRLAVN
jgi:RNA-directed DNA polymerase